MHRYGYSTNLGIRHTIAVTASFKQSQRAIRVVAPDPSPPHHTLHTPWTEAGGACSHLRALAQVHGVEHRGGCLPPDVRRIPVFAAIGTLPPTPVPCSAAFKGIGILVLIPVPFANRPRAGRHSHALRGRTC